MWSRVCSRCNGIIYKREGAHIPSNNYGSRHFIIHKDVKICKQRNDIRIPKEKEQLMNLPDNITPIEWYNGLLERIKLITA